MQMAECQATGCRRAALPGAVRLVLDKRGGLDVFVCDTHRIRLREWAKTLATASPPVPPQTEGDDWRRVDQGDEG
jgi:hypothetical protein